MNETLTIALSKGRIFDETLPLLAAAGIEVLENPETSRKLILPEESPDSNKDIVFIRNLTIRPAPLCKIPFVFGVEDPVKMI